MQLKFRLLFTIYPNRNFQKYYCFKLSYDKFTEVVRVLRASASAFYGILFSSKISTQNSFQVLQTGCRDCVCTLRTMQMLLRIFSRFSCIEKIFRLVCSTVRISHIISSCPTRNKTSHAYYRIKLQNRIMVFPLNRASLKHNVRCRLKKPVRHWYIW